MEKYKNSFDILYLEGGILHYFNDIDKFMGILFSILKSGGRMILSDYHPIKRCIGSEFKYIPNYFDNELHNGELAYKQYFEGQNSKNSLMYL